MQVFMNKNFLQNSGNIIIYMQPAKMDPKETETWS